MIWLPLAYALVLCLALVAVLAIFSDVVNSLVYTAFAALVLLIMSLVMYPMGFNEFACGATAAAGFGFLGVFVRGVSYVGYKGEDWVPDAW